MLLKFISSSKPWFDTNFTYVESLALEDMLMIMAITSTITITMNQTWRRKKSRHKSNFAFSSNVVWTVDNCIKLLSSIATALPEAWPNWSVVFWITDTWRKTEKKKQHKLILLYSRLSNAYVRVTNGKPCPQTTQTKHNWKSWHKRHKI